MSRLGDTVDGEVCVVADNSGNGAVGRTGDGGRDAVLLNVVTDDLLSVDSINGFLAHAKEEGRHCGEVEVEVGVDESDEAQAKVFVDGALERD